MEATSPEYYTMIVRSKDKTTGTNSNFQVQFPFPTTMFQGKHVDMTLTNVLMGAFPQINDTLANFAVNTNSGLANQPDFPSSNGVDNSFVFNTFGGVDICLGTFATSSILDTETANNTGSYTTSIIINANGVATTTLNVACYNKTGIFSSGTTPASQGDLVSIAGINGYVSGFTSNGFSMTIASQTTTSIPSGTVFTVQPKQPYKTRSDTTIALLPYSRTNQQKCIQINTAQPTLKFYSPVFSFLNVKIFDDLGFPLKLRKLFCAAQGDQLDYNLGHWSMTLALKVY